VQAHSNAAEVLLAQLDRQRRTGQQRIQQLHDTTERIQTLAQQQADLARRIRQHQDQINGASWWNRWWVWLAHSGHRNWNQRQIQQNRHPTLDAYQRHIDPLQAQVNPYTSRGFTGHEHIPAFGLIHMNGRVYDPEVGRFLSADPFIQAPYNSQSYNRYSYVLNNPLKYVDPSGYFWKSICNSIRKNWNSFTRTVSQFVGNNSNSNRNGSNTITRQEAQRYFSGTYQTA
jgi:RHS repeat-associated protein